MREIHTEVTIAAPAERVWHLLANLEDYERWNPFLVRASGDVRPGGILRVRIRPPGASESPYRLVVTAVDECRQFGWRGKMLFGWVMTGDHMFELEVLDSQRTKLIHREQFRGAMVPLVWRAFLNTKLRRGFEEMNQAIKAEAEKTASS